MNLSHVYKHHLNVYPNVRNLYILSFLCLVNESCINSVRSHFFPEMIIIAQCRVWINHETLINVVKHFVIGLTIVHTENDSLKKDPCLAVATEWTYVSQVFMVAYGISHVYSGITNCKIYHWWAYTSQSVIWQIVP